MSENQTFEELTSGVELSDGDVEIIMDQVSKRLRRSRRVKSSTCRSPDPSHQDAPGYSTTPHRGQLLHDRLLILLCSLVEASETLVRLVLSLRAANPPFASSFIICC